MAVATVQTDWRDAVVPAEAVRAAIVEVERRAVGTWKPDRRGVEQIVSKEIVLGVAAWISIAAAVVYLLS